MPIIWEPFVKFADFALQQDYIGLYFYSAVFQGNMALIAIFGVFLVFRLQSLDQEIAKALTDAKEHIYSKILNHVNTVVYPVVRKINSLERLRDCY
jgi:hypothetical protein